MARGTPSMTALLGLLAVAGYQNREKIGDLIGKAKEALTQSPPETPADSANTSGGLLNDFDKMFGEKEAGPTLSTGLNDVAEQFRKTGQGNTVDSWIGKSTNQQLNPASLQQSLGDDMLDELVAKTGLSKTDLLARLSTSLPEAVDTFTPDGSLPSADQASRYR
ncbi:MAG: YidB family protein [Burkholderiaceae bacterium]